MTKLLSISTDTKTSKGESKGYLTGIMYLSHGSLSGKNLCPFASKGCLKTCLYTAGRGVFQSVKTARMKRTRLYLDNRQEFFSQLIDEIKSLERKAIKKGLVPVVRLNGTSDVPFELMPVYGLPNIMSHFPHIQFYDYTKNPYRFKNLPKNYHLTFSRSESNEKYINILPREANVAVVFSEVLEGNTMYSRKVILGDETDLRFLDPKGAIVGLKAKGKAIKDTSGFVLTK